MIHGLLKGGAGEAPTALQRIGLLVTAVLTLVLACLWLMSGPGWGGDSLLEGVVFMLLFSEWLALGLLLRPRGTGLRRSVGARLLAFGFGVSHLALGSVQFLDPIVIPRPGSRSDPLRWGVGIWALGAIIIGAAAQAHWAAQSRGPGDGGPPKT